MCRLIHGRSSLVGHKVRLLSPCGKKMKLSLLLTAKRVQIHQRNYVKKKTSLNFEKEAGDYVYDIKIGRDFISET